MIKGSGSRRPKTHTDPHHCLPLSYTTPIFGYAAHLYNYATYWLSYVLYSFHIVPFISFILAFVYGISSVLWILENLILVFVRIVHLLLPARAKARKQTVLHVFAEQRVNFCYV
jgi:hypothetical protein